MRHTLAGWICGLFFLAFTLPVLAAEKGTADDAVALVKKAVEMIKAKGRDQALAEYNNPKGRFIDRDLYIFAIDKDGLTVANGANQKLVGKNVMEMRDTDGKYFIKKFFELAKDKGHGWVEYRWSNQITHTMEMKSTYIEQAEGLIIGCGIYK